MHSSPTAAAATARTNGPIAIGSDAHKRLFCALMLDTHDPYDPDRIEWPALDDDARARLAALPFWNDAVTTEDAAARDLRTLAVAEPDPLVREAVALQGFEENRHERVIGGLCRAYGIETRVIPGYLPPRDPEWGYLRMGYGECFDSFFAFGLFALARQSGYFPAELVRVFEPVIQEEARHIVFFVNWVAWCRANRPAWQRPLHAARCARALSLQAWRRLRTARTAGEAKGFTRKGASSLEVDLDPRTFFALCLAENERRMAGYDANLLRPKVMPAAVSLALRLMPGG